MNCISTINDTVLFKKKIMRRTTVLLLLHRLFLMTCLSHFTNTTMSTPLETISHTFHSNRVQLVPSFGHDQTQPCSNCPTLGYCVCTGLDIGRYSSPWLVRHTAQVSKDISFLRICYYLHLVMRFCSFKCFTSSSSHLRAYLFVEEARSYITGFLVEIGWFLPFWFLDILTLNRRLFACSDIIF
jgi:hypothetical protein